VSQLSVAVPSVSVAAPLASKVKVTSAAVNDGSSSSVTVTVIDEVAVRPAASVAVYVMVVVPIGKV